MKTSIIINKKTLLSAIEDNCDAFGDSFSGLYVDVDGNVSCVNKSDSGDLMPILTFSGMGEFIDENGNYPSDEDYDSNSVAAYIVDDGECLNFNGELCDGNGECVEYAFVIEG